ncbi:MAG: hypothetical protein R3D66_02015 [Alphaproteobacteria bacterium]
MLGAKHDDRTRHSFQPDQLRFIRRQANGGCASSAFSSIKALSETDFAGEYQLPPRLPLIFSFCAWAVTAEAAKTIIAKEKHRIVLRADKGMDHR